MKKALAIFIAFLMLLSSVPLSVSAATVDAKIYGPVVLTNGLEFSTAGIEYVLDTENGENYIHGNVKAGTYTNNTLQMVFAPADFSITEYKYVKVGYRTNSTSKVINITTRSTVGESWLTSHPACQGDGKWQELIVNIDGIVGGAGVPVSGELGISFIMKPFGAQTVTVEKDSFFDVKYIACFKNEADAKAYKYSSSDDKTEAEAEADSVVFWEEASDELINGYMDTMDEMIESIENSPTSVEVTGTKYYVSSSGNDNNDGKTPETAWKTIDKVNKMEFSAGDGVFFKRGDEWRTISSLSAKSGVTYSAYGSGAKPKIIASVDGSGSGMWASTSYENVYAFTENLPGSRDVGNIVFDGGRAWGIQIQQTKGGTRHEIGTVFNGIETFATATGAFAGAKDLNNDLEFYHDWDSETLYVYSKEGNPGERFSSIEIVDRGNGIALVQDEEAGSAHDIVIDNIEIYGAGSHGIGGGTVKNVTVQYCVLKWIGGSIQAKYIFNRDFGVRFGNAVESYGNSENFVIHDCYASQIYDCCWTVQTQSKGQFIDIKMYNNVSEYCNSGLEIWQNGGTIQNMELYNNYTRFNGYGWSHQRFNKDSNFFYGGGDYSSTYINNSVHDNVNLFASSQALKCRATGPKQYNFNHNVYIMELGKYMGGIATNPGTATGTWGSANIKYDKKTLIGLVATGFEEGAKFYYTDPEPFGYMYDTFDPQNGVSLFDDIADDFWGRDAIDYAVLSGLFNGVSETEFSPNGTMTRGMLVTVLSRLAGESGTGATTFTDVNSNAWFAPGVSWAEQNGIVDAGGKFRPDDKATREEMADMLYRYALSQYKKVDLSSAKSFTDSANVDAKYADGVKFCTANGIIGGYEDGTIKPKNSATRAEVATMIRRFKSCLASAPIDTERALAEAKFDIISGEALKKMLDNTGVRATAEADGTVKFVPFLESGCPNIRILDTLSKDVSLIDYPYVVIKYRGELDTARVVASVSEIEIANGSSSDTGVKSSAKLEDGALMLDLSDLIADIDATSYEDNLAINIRPWGEASVELSNTEYFVIYEIARFDSKFAAQAYCA